MGKVTKVFDLKTRIKLTIDITEEDLDELLIEAAGVVQAGVCEGRTTKKQWHLANHFVQTAAAGGYEALIEAVITELYRGAIRDGLMELPSFDSGITMSPPQLVFKR